MTLFNRIDGNGVVLEEGIRLTPLTPSLEPGHQFVPYAYPLDRVKEDMIQKVKDIRDNKLVHGGFKVNDKWFHSDTFSRSQQLGLTIVGQGLPNNIQWKTMDGTKITLTPPIVQQLFSSAMVQDNSIFGYAEYLVAQIQAASVPEVIDITAGWPETFRNI